VRIAPHPLLPEIFCYQRNIGAFLLFGQEIPAENGTHTEHVKVIRSQSSAKDLDRITQAGQSENEEILTGETFADRLAITKMFEARGGNRKIHDVPRFVAAKPVDHARRLLERQPAQKEIVHQTEDGGVESDAEREREHGDRSEGRRLSKFAKRESNIVHVCS